MIADGRNCLTLLCAVFYTRLNKPVDSVAQSERERTKRVVYSIMYGVGKHSDVLGNKKTR